MRTFRSNISRPWFTIQVKCSSHKFKPFPFSGKAKITGKIKSLEIPVERQDDAVLNNIEGLNHGLFYFCFDY